MSDTNSGEGIEDAKNYLRTGGLGEVMGLATMAIRMKQPKIQMDTDMAIALCIFADRAIKREKLQ